MGKEGKAQKVHKKCIFSFSFPAKVNIMNFCPLLSRHEGGEEGKESFFCGGGEALKILFFVCACGKREIPVCALFLEYVKYAMYKPGLEEREEPLKNFAFSQAIE